MPLLTYHPKPVAYVMPVVSKVTQIWGFPGGPPSNARDVSSIPNRETNIPHAVGQLSLHTAPEHPCSTTGTSAAK